tara:strand:- start:167 stop:451 length:285 start_codon:yes stop_codon:yes gene_type:complete
MSQIFCTTETPMKCILQPWQLMLFILARWVNRQQQEVIDYLRTENSVLKEKFGKQRILLTDDHRRSPCCRKPCGVQVKRWIHWTVRYLVTSAWD